MDDRSLFEGKHREAGTPASQEQLVGLEQEGRIAGPAPVLVAAAESLADEAATGLDPRQQQVQPLAVQVAGHQHDLEPLVSERPPPALEVAGDGLSAGGMNPGQGLAVTVGSKDPIAGRRRRTDVTSAATGEVEQGRTAGRLAQPA